MLYWQILTDANDEAKKILTFDVFGKTYLEQLVWYYAQHTTKINVLLPQNNQALSDKLSQQYKNLEIDCNYDNTKRTIILDSHYAIIDVDCLVDDAKAIAAEQDARIYYYKGHVVAILLTTELRQKLLQQDEVATDYKVLEELEQLLLNVAPNSDIVKLRKKQVVSVKKTKGMRRFMVLLNRTKQRQLLKSGVFILDKKSTWIEPDVHIGAGSYVYPATMLRGKTSIGTDCQIGPAARIIDSQLANAVTVKDSTVLSSSIDDNTTIGPYAYIRPNSEIGKDVKIGDFVEVKNAQIGDGSKASHLSYIGDGVVGKNVNIGCGSVFVNYDGHNKHKTVVEDNCFIGCNANLVAPVTVKAGSYVAAGSTITDDVPSDSLAIARAHQTVKQDWAKKWAQNNKK